jgi:hypothetical protein
MTLLYITFFPCDYKSTSRKSQRGRRKMINKNSTASKNSKVTLPLKNSSMNNNNDDTESHVEDKRRINATDKGDDKTEEKQ